VKRTILNLTAGAVILGVMGVAAATDITPKMMRQAAKAADQAVGALKEHQRMDAVRYAERAVLYNPESADNRALLGQAYLQAGRFISSETAFRDALRLDGSHGRAALGLALVETALGKNDRALAALETARGRVPDVDLGLALALAGNPSGGVAVLEPAVRAQGASAKARQNLALSYALAGRWAEARVTAAQDLPADKVDQRMIEWAQFVRPRGSADQLSSLMGVKSVMDSGMPEQLALLDAKPQQAAQVAVAPVENVPAVSASAVSVEPEAVSPVAEVAPVPAVASVPAEKVAVVAVAPVSVAPTSVPVAKPLFVTAAAAEPATSSAKTPMFIKPVNIAPSKPMVFKTSAFSTRNSNFVIQLGAFSSADRLERAWTGVVSRVSWLQDYSPVSATFAAPQDNRTLHRLSISGFSSRIEAVNVCRKVRENGRDCFVRGLAGDAPIQWVSRKTNQLYASR